MRRVVVAAVIAAMLVLGLAPAAMAGEPTCAGLGETGWENHGTHIIEQYIIDGDFDALTGNPSDELGGGQVDSTKVVANAGKAGKGHLAAGVAPGASFCTDSESPGAHPGA